jgi:hypothetical protein
MAGEMTLSVNGKKRVVSSAPEGPGIVLLPVRACASWSARTPIGWESPRLRLFERQERSV